MLRIVRSLWKVTGSSTADVPVKFQIDKKIERHTAQTIVLWPNPKQWTIVHPSDLMMIIRKKCVLSQSSQAKWVKRKNTQLHIYIMITKNIRYLLWSQGLWRSLNNAYPIFLTPCIRCTKHLCDSRDLTDVNPHFIPSLLRMNQNVDLLWRHRYKSRSPAIVSQWPIVPAWLLWTLS